MGADCWSFPDGIGGQSWRGAYLPHDSKEPEAGYQQRLANARLIFSFRDALCTYAGMLPSVQWHDLSGSLAGVLSDLFGLGRTRVFFVFAYLPEFALAGSRCWCWRNGTG